MLFRSGCTSLAHICCDVVTPLSIQSTVFDNVDKTKCILEVPSQSIEAYKAAPIWSEFLNITNVSLTQKDTSVYVFTNGRTINILGLDDSSIVSIYNTKGQKVYQGTERTIQLDATGIYIVKTANKSYKVIL